MIAVYVRITECVNEIRGLQITFSGDQMEQECIACNVKRNSAEDIRTSLIQLKSEFSIHHIELEESVARCEGHRADFEGVPCYDDMPSIAPVVAEALDDVFDRTGK